MHFEIYFFSGNDYFLGRKGETTCSGGDVITRSSLCKEACKELGIPFKTKDMKTGKICYKDAKGKCYQDGFQGAGAFMICEKGCQIIMNIFDHPPFYTIHVTSIIKNYFILFLAQCDGLETSVNIKYNTGFVEVSIKNNRS